MRKEIIICVFEYSKTQIRTKGKEESSVYVSGNSSSYPNFEFESSIRALNLNIYTECGEFIKNEDGSYGKNIKSIPIKVL